MLDIVGNDVEGTETLCEVFIPSERHWTNFYLDMVRSEVRDGARYLLSALANDGPLRFRRSQPK